MNTKLTLTIEKEVIEFAKEFAKEKGQSLSELVENYFIAITTEKRSLLEPNQLSPRIQRLRGIIKSDIQDYKQEIYSELRKKYEA